MAKAMTITPGAAVTNAPIQLKATDKNLTIQTLDQNGKEMPDVTADKVTVEIVEDDSSLLKASPGADSQHWTFTISANATGTVTLTITETYLDGSFGPFTDVQPLVLPTPPSPVPTSISVVVS